MTDILDERPVRESRGRRKADIAEASYKAAREAQTSGNPRLARSLFERVLDQEPFHAQALHWLGVIDFVEGSPDIALKRVTKALELAPGQAEILDNYGTILQHFGRVEESADAYRKAVEADPANIHAITNLASTMVRLKQFEAAAGLAKKALSLQPNNASASGVLGHIAAQKKDYATALVHHRAAMQAAPRDAETHYNYGVALQELFRYEEAIEAYDNAIALNTKHARYYVNRGAALLKVCRVAEAKQSYIEALKRELNLAEAHYNLAISEFLLGDYPEASAHYEWRLKVADAAGLNRPREVPGPRWDGKPAPGKTLLIVHEQGLGDSVQFVRLAALARQRVGRVLVEVQPRLKPLFASIPEIEVYAAGEALPAYDFHAPMMSLIYLLGLRVEQLPAAPTPYLTLEPARVEKWRKILAQKPGIPIGIRWQGNPKAKVDRGRSIDLKMLAPIAAIPGVRLISLQKDEGADQIASCGFPVEVLDGGLPSGSPDTLLEDAALIQNLDLVISTDTMIAHLAGALGRPTWTILKPACDWRWLLERTDCPWYPTMRLFRATQEGGFEEAIERVARTLAKGVGKRQGRKKMEPIPAPLPNKQARLVEGIKLHQSGQFAEAAAIYNEALAQNPREATALHYLGVMAYQQDRPEEAEKRIAEALSIEKNNPEIYSNYVLALKKLGRFDEAVAACKQALALRPSYPEAESNYGNVLAEMGRYEEALPHYRAAVQGSPTRGEFHANYAQALRECQQLEAATDEFRLALKARPGHAETRYDLAITLLASGQWAEGWREYESRRLVPAYGAVTALPQPEWDGSPAKDKVLMVHAEQGLGDTFQFLRFLSAARSRVRALVLVVQPNIKSVLANVPGASGVFAYGERLPDFDVKIPLPSLPLALGLGKEVDVQMDKPYLLPPPDAVEKWRAQLADKPGFKVGLSWQGNPNARVDKGRSMPLEKLLPLSGVPGARFISLQKGEAAKQVANLAREFKVETFDGGVITADSFAGDAALIAALDLVITTDTAVAHLAGAMGKPVWVMLRYAPDWRWQRGRADTPWYPSARLFRQQKRGDWTGVVNEVKAALALETGIRRPTVARPATDDVAVQLEKGLALHQAGKVKDSIAVYDAILNQSPQHPIALHYKGVALYQTDRAAEGEVLIRQALALKPDYIEAIGNLGLAQKAQGKIDEAVATYRRALEFNPDYAEAHNNLGNLFAGQKKFEEALKHHQAGVKLQPGKAENYSNLGNTLGDLERYAEAATAFEQALKLSPHNVNALNGLGKTYKMLERLDDAAACYRRAITAAPLSPDGWSNLGVIMREKGDYEGALKCYEEALKLKPDHAETLGNMALALHHMGRPEESETNYRKALISRPDSADSHFGLASVLLETGRWEEGWKEYAWRKKIRDFGPGRSFSRPEWDGKPAPGRTLFLHTEQGLGDTVQWARFIKLAASRVGRITVEAQKSLIPLIETVEGVDSVTAQGEPPAAHDIQCSLLDLPHLLNVTLAKLPAEVPYLVVDPERVKSWSKKLSAAPGLRVGINWQGNPKGQIDKGRSMPLTHLAPFAKVPDVRLISLQKGEAAAQMENCGFAVEAIDDPMEYGPGPMSDTAAQMMNMDLIITTDTSIAHLAGALGRPVWVMLKYHSDWRWMNKRSDSPWYPTMQLFRQPKMGDWESVIKSVAKELKKIVS